MELSEMEQKAAALNNTTKSFFHDLVKRSSKYVLHDEYSALHSLLTGDVDSYISRDCLARGIVSPYVFRQLETLVDSIAQYIVGPELVNERFIELSNRIMEIKIKFDDIESLCDKLLLIPTTVQDIDHRLDDYKNIVHSIQAENESFRQDISDKIKR